MGLRTLHLNIINFKCSEWDSCRHFVFAPFQIRKEGNLLASLKSCDFFQVLRCCKRKNSEPSFKLVDILSSSQVVQRRNLAPNFKLSESFENKKLTNLGYEPRFLIK